jgi:hypothetical protein
MMSNSAEKWEYRISWFNRVTSDWNELAPDQRSYHNFQALLAPWQDVADYMNQVGSEGWEIFQIREVAQHNWDDPLKAYAESSARSLTADLSLTFNLALPTMLSEVIVVFFYARRRAQTGR